MSDPAPPFPCRKAEVLHIIRTRSLWGKGRDGDPIREVVQLWTLEGELLATIDPTAANQGGAR